MESNYVHVFINGENKHTIRKHFFDWTVGNIVHPIHTVYGPVNWKVLAVTPQDYGVDRVDVEDLGVESDDCYACNGTGIANRGSWERLLVGHDRCNVCKGKGNFKGG